uniref:C2H2-type domain-containing protein n=1 Tax=Mycolicibacterium phage phi1_186018 TaxID=3236641 RepID=A0AB39AKS4_9CAUD
MPTRPLRWRRRSWHFTTGWPVAGFCLRRGQLAADMVRCSGSDKAPARTFRGHAYCAACGRRFAVKANGMVRRHFSRASSRQNSS